jgi:hypothetical protein
MAMQCPWAYIGHVADRTIWTYYILYTYLTRYQKLRGGGYALTGVAAMPPRSRPCTVVAAVARYTDIDS